MRQRAERRQLLAVEPGVLDELRGLRGRVPHLTGSLAATTDGLVLARDTAEVRVDSVAILVAEALEGALRLAEASGRGAFRELLVRGDHGYLATYLAGGTAVVTVLASPRTNVGRLHLESRRAGARIGELVDGVLERAEHF